MDTVEQSAVRVAVKIQLLRDEDGNEQFKATLPMAVLFEKSLDRAELERARARLEENYRALIHALRAERAALKSRSPLPYWRLGDAITQFEAAQAQTPVFVDQLISHLVRDVPFSETMLLLCRRFREKFPDARRIDPRTSFTRYHRAGFDPARLARPARQRKTAR